MVVYRYRGKIQISYRIFQKIFPYPYQIKIYTDMQNTAEKMTIREIKQTAKKNIQTIYSFSKGTTSLGIIAIKDPIKRKFIAE